MSPPQNPTSPNKEVSANFLLQLPEVSFHGWLKKECDNKLLKECKFLFYFIYDKIFIQIFIHFHLFSFDVYQNFHLNCYQLKDTCLSFLQSTLKRSLVISTSQAIRI